MQPKTVGFELRTFRWDDLEALSRLMRGLLEAGEDHQPMTPAYLRALLQQPGCDPEQNCLLAHISDRLVGYGLVSPEVPIGRAVIEGGVALQERGRGVGSALLEAALQRAAELGARVAHLCVPEGSPAASFLERRGLPLARCYWEMEWTGETVPLVEAPQEVAVRPMEPDEVEVLTRMQNAAFQGSWGFCPNTVEQIAYRVRMPFNRPEDVLFLTREGEVVGYCWTRVMETKRGLVGGVPMIGVAPGNRGLGLGRVVLLAGIRSLRARGVDRVTLTTDEANVAAGKLYESVGFSRARTLHWYEARLSPSSVE
ncbi:MAG: GNAT family N-acetyltransferase [Dehalococcoidia bacterium]